MWAAGHRGLQRVADRVPQVVAVQGGDPEAPGGRVDEHHRAGPGGRLPERQEEVVAQIPAAHAGRDLHAVQAGHGHQAGQFLRGQARVLHRDRPDRAEPPGVAGHQPGQRLVLHPADQLGLAGLRVHRHQVDPRGQQQVVNPGGGRVAEHDPGVAELADRRGQFPAAEPDDAVAVLGAQHRPPGLGHAARRHLRDDDVAVRVDDQRVAVPFAAGPFARAAAVPSAAESVPAPSAGIASASAAAMPAAAASAASAAGDAVPDESVTAPPR